MWCGNKQLCVQTNSYVASFIYGQCMEWTTQQAKCPGKFMGFVWHGKTHFTSGSYGNVVIKLKNGSKNWLKYHMNTQTIEPVVP
jgi:hypothetical protein